MGAVDLEIDFVSDVGCPWCAIGLASLEQALANSADRVQALIRFQPFELNPNMPPDGEAVSHYLTRKYGSTPEQQATVRAAIAQRGADLGFEFRAEGRKRIWNTFHAHRLLMWAGDCGAEGQLRLKRALLMSYHGRAENPNDPQVLRAAVREASLNETAANDVIDDPLAYSRQVRERELYYHDAGVTGVPAIIVNRHYLISGGQPPEVFEEALQRIASQVRELDSATATSA